MHDEEGASPVFAEQERIAAGLEQPPPEVDNIFDEIGHGDDWRDYVYDDGDEIPVIGSFAGAGNEQVIIIVGRHSTMRIEMHDRIRDELPTNGVRASRQLFPRVIRFFDSMSIDTTSMRALHVMHFGRASRPVLIQLPFQFRCPNIRTFVRPMAAIRAINALHQHPPNKSRWYCEAIPDSGWPVKSGHVGGICVEV